MLEILRAEMDFMAGNQRSHWFAGVERGTVQESFAAAGGMTKMAKAGVPLHVDLAAG